MRRWARVVSMVLVVGAFAFWAGAASAAEVDHSPVVDVVIHGDAFVSVSVHGGDVAVTVLPDWRTADYSTITVTVKDKAKVQADPPCMMFADAPDIN